MSASVPALVAEANPAAPARHWIRPVVTALAVIGALLVGLLLFEAVHWALEGFPPPREHAAELLESLHGKVAGLKWHATVAVFRDGWMW